MDKETARQEIAKLIERFVAQQPYYESNSYLERQLQTDFIDKLFEGLGWDIANRKGLSPFDREVLVEKGDTKGRPDYSFRMNGEDMFFVEAKAASKGTDNPDYAFQAKRYGYSTRKVSVVVLTDFKTFKVFDSSLKPDVKQPRVGLLFELEFTKYTSSDFDKLWLFAHGEVVAGSLDRLSSKEPGAKRLRIPVDAVLIEQMTQWREMLAKDVHKNNTEIGVRELNDVVQRLLDRLVFIRILEDRKIIESKTLKEIAENWNESKHRDIQFQLNALFKQLNDDFNGEIFKPHPCETTKFESKTVAGIIEDLYYPCPYDFAIIPVQILGIIYEKYLGKTIRLTEKRVIVEEKPEVRKAGGVYYTPQWVVDYIVENTVGKIIENKKPDEIAKLHVLDPACGSGSFLIGALERLFRHHFSYYQKNPKDAKRGTLFPNLIIEKDADGNETHRLSIEKKSEILKNNIYGVDIDPQAVEITMMSLYIKVLEGEKTLPHNKELMPSLSNNIRCGNSLIGTDFFQQKTLAEDEERVKINAFNWESTKDGFGTILESGKFQAIIGNPPYVRIQILNETAPEQVEYFSTRYTTAGSGNYDIYALFVEKAINLLGETGRLGFILPHKFFQAEYGRNLRKIISEKKLVRQIVSFGDQQVFEGASTYTCLLFLDFQKKDNFKYAELRKLENPVALLKEVSTKQELSNQELEISQIPTKELSEEAWHIRSKVDAKIFEKLDRIQPKLNEICEKMFQGVITSADDIFMLKFEKESTKEKVEVYSEALSKKIVLERALLKPYIKGKEVKAFSVQPTNTYLIFPYPLENNSLDLISEKEFEKDYPKTHEYLKLLKPVLVQRERGKMNGPKWYGFTRPQSLMLFSKPKIITPFNAFSNQFFFDEKGEWYFTAGVAGGYGLILSSEYLHFYPALTAILNSKLMEYWVKKTSTALRGGYYSFEYRFIKDIPIVLPSSEIQKKAYGELSKLSTKISILRKEQNQTNDPQKKNMLDREVNVYLEKIDELVFELYELTPETRKIIENSIK